MNFPPPIGPKLMRHLLVYAALIALSGGSLSAQTRCGSQQASACSNNRCISAPKKTCCLCKLFGRKEPQPCGNCNCRCRQPAQPKSCFDKFLNADNGGCSQCGPAARQSCCNQCGNQPSGNCGNACAQSSSDCVPARKKGCLICRLFSRKRSGSGCSLNRGRGESACSSEGSQCGANCGSSRGVRYHGGAAAPDAPRNPDQFTPPNDSQQVPKSAETDVTLTSRIVVAPNHGDSAETCKTCGKMRAVDYPNVSRCAAPPSLHDMPAPRPRQHVQGLPVNPILPAGFQPDAPKCAVPPRSRY